MFKIVNNNNNKKETMIKVKESMRKTPYQIDDINKKIFLKIKESHRHFGILGNNTVIKNSLEEFHSRFELVEEN